MRRFNAPRAWDARQDAVLRRCGKGGAAACIRLLRARFGVSRTRAQVARRAALLDARLGEKEAGGGSVETPRHSRRRF